MLQKPSSGPTAAVVAAAVFVLMWSSGFIGADLGTRFASAATLLSWRYLVAGSLLVLVVLARRMRFTRGTVLRQAVLGLLCQCMYLGFVVGGVGMGVPAGTAALVASLQPLVVAAVAGPLLGERTHAVQRLGLAIGIAGVACVVGGNLLVGGVPFWVYLMPVAGMLSLASGTVLERRWDPAESVLSALTVQNVVAAVFFTLLAVVQGDAAVPSGPGFWGAVAWVVVLSGFGGYGGYLLVLRTQGATRVSTLLCLTPPTTMLWAYVMFGDRIGPLEWTGLVVTALGVGLALRSRRPAPAPQRSSHRSSQGSSQRY